MFVSNAQGTLNLVERLVYLAKADIPGVTKSLDTIVSRRAGSHYTLRDTMAMRDPDPSPLDQMILREELEARQRKAVAALKAVREKLEQREWDIVLDAANGVTYADMGRKYDLTREGARQIHLRALRKLGIQRDENEPHRICKFCGTRFIPCDKSQLYCSSSCSSSRIGSAQPPRACVMCGEMFTPPLPHAVYCSYKCQREGNYARKREAYRRFREANPPRPITCGVCGTEFLRPSSNAKYCSDNCKHTARLRRERRSQA